MTTQIMPVSCARSQTHAMGRLSNIMEDAGCSKMNPCPWAYDSVINNADRATWRLPSRTHACVVLPRQSILERPVLLRDMKIQVEHTVPSHSHPNSSINLHHCSAVMNPTPPFKSCSDPCNTSKPRAGMSNRSSVRRFTAPWPQKNSTANMLFSLENESD